MTLHFTDKENIALAVKKGRQLLEDPTTKILHVTPGKGVVLQTSRGDILTVTPTWVSFSPAPSQ